MSESSARPLAGIRNLKDARGLTLARRLALRSGVLIENFRPGVLGGLGLSYESLSEENPRLIYCSLKGFLAGPYAHRTALDEVAQLARLEAAGLPFAPIGRPEDLFDDPHLRANGGLAATTLPDGRNTHLPILPLELSGGRPTGARTLPAAGEHTGAILAALGVGADELATLEAEHVI